MEGFRPKPIEKKSISIRLDKVLLSEINKRAANAKMSKSEFIKQCLEFALEHIFI